MSQTTEEYQSSESEIKISWIWSKALSVGKKFLIACVVVSSAPLLVPLLVFAVTIALFASVPFGLLLGSYACTQKLMSGLLSATEETSGIENDEPNFEFIKRGYGEGTTEFDELSLIQTEEDEEMAKESTSLIERLRDEGRTDIRISEKDDENMGYAKSEKVQDPIRKRDAEELGDTTTETFTGKDEESSSNEPVDQATSAPHGTGEEKRKNANKKKKKTGRAGV